MDGWNEGPITALELTNRGKVYRCRRYIDKAM